MQVQKEQLTNLDTCLKAHVLKRNDFKNGSAFVPSEDAVADSGHCRQSCNGETPKEIAWQPRKEAQGKCLVSL